MTSWYYDSDVVFVGGDEKDESEAESEIKTLLQQYAQSRIQASERNSTKRQSERELALKNAARVVLQLQHIYSRDKCGAEQDGYNVADMRAKFQRLRDLYGRTDVHLNALLTGLAAVQQRVPTIKALSCEEIQKVLVELKDKLEELVEAAPSVSATATASSSSGTKRARPAEYGPMDADLEEMLRGWGHKVPRTAAAPRTPAMEAKIKEIHALLQYFQAQSDRVDLPAAIEEERKATMRKQFYKRVLKQLPNTREITREWVQSLLRKLRSDSYLAILKVQFADHRYDEVLEPMRAELIAYLQQLLEQQLAQWQAEPGTDIAFAVENDMNNLTTVRAMKEALTSVLRWRYLKQALEEVLANRADHEKLLQFRRRLGSADFAAKYFPLEWLNNDKGNRLIELFRTLE